MAGDGAAAIEHFERSFARKSDGATGANLLQCYIDAKRFKEANALSAKLLTDWPDNPAVLGSVAHLAEQQGQPAVALSLLRDESIDLDAASAVYPFYLRLLVENGRFEEALQEADRGFNSLWRIEASISRGLSLLHFGDDRQAIACLRQIDFEEFRELLGEWAQALHNTGIAQTVAALLDGAIARNPDEDLLRRVRESLLKSPAPLLRG